MKCRQKLERAKCIQDKIVEHPPRPFASWHLYGSHLGLCKPVEGALNRRGFSTRSHVVGSPHKTAPAGYDTTHDTKQAVVTSRPVQAVKGVGGPGRARTDDLFHAMEARSQLRHRPIPKGMILRIYVFQLSPSFRRESNHGTHGF